MLWFIKKYFFTGLTFVSIFTSVNSLSCVSMNNQECKVRPQIVTLVFPLVLKQVNAAVVATRSIIHLQNCALLMLLKM